MALPLNIDDLINGKTVEWDRIEFKEGWNPQRTIHTICAFANDFNNWGGGYIILGIAEQEGKPVLPPVGISLTQIDSIQKELNNLCRRILPNYFPKVEPVDFQGKKILILWCPGGSNRPYKAPGSLSQNSQYFYFIRRFSSTVRPNLSEEQELSAMANRIPFDDALNHQAHLSDLDLSTIKSFLNEIKSDLEFQIPDLSINEIARQLNIAEGPDEYLLPKNVGLLFFAKNPQHFFPYVKIEIVSFKDEDGDSFNEKIFTGPLHTQLLAALLHIKNLFIEEKISKIAGKAEADRFFNYPYEAIEEALSNAVFHRGYDDNSTIEVRVFPSRIDILSFPGPIPPMDKEKLKAGIFDVRKYRNRRIGEFLKELHLTEGRATGIPKIKKALAKNGSPPPIFETDDNRTYFKTTLLIHPEFLIESNKSSEGVGLELGRSRDQVGTKLGLSWDQVVSNTSISREEVEKLLEECLTQSPISELMKQFNWSNRTKFKKKFINPLLKMELITMTIPEKPNSSLQKYITTEKGKLLLKINQST